MQLRAYLASGNPFLLSPQLRKKTAINKSKGKNDSSSSSGSEGSALLPSGNNFSSLYSSISQLIIISETESKSNGRNGNRQTSTTARKVIRRQSKVSYEEIERNIKELEVIDLASEFLGVNGKVLYQTSLMLLTYIGLLAYTQVFNGSFVSQICSSTSPNK
jgi:hypothetical protein